MTAVIRDIAFMVDDPPGPKVPADVPKRSADVRPKIVLLVGDGFTQGFLADLGLQNRIRCGVGDLICPPLELAYVPAHGDRLSGQLWDEGKWPRIFEFWKSHGNVTGSEFFQRLKDELPINPDLLKDAWTFNTASLGYELRAYLWHFFRSIDRAISASLPDLCAWIWSKPLLWLAQHTRFDVVSFNYDLIFEKTMKSIMPEGVITPLANPLPHTLPDHPAGHVLVSKPHGSIGHNLYPGVIYNANQWLDPLVIDSVSMHMNTTVGFHPANVPRTGLHHFPIIPDLVPPGRRGKDVCSPQAWECARRYPKNLLRSADIVVACGLSGAPPDEDEVTDMLSVVRPDAHRLHVGRVEYADTVVARCLGGPNGERYRFLRHADVGELPAIIAALAPAG